MTMHLAHTPRQHAPKFVPQRGAGLPSTGDLAIGPVLNHHQFLAASLLTRRMYAWRGYQTEGLSNYSDTTNRITLAAWQQEEILATLTVGRDSHAGLLSETLYGDEVSGLRQTGRTICECTRLAVDPEHSSRHLLLSLFSTAHQYARAFFGATDALIEVNPRHARFYQREFGFAQIGETRLCPRVEAPAILMHRDLTTPAVVVV
jgi:hypothetical protein